MGLDQTLMRICKSTKEVTDITYWRNDKIVQKIFNPNHGHNFRKVINECDVKMQFSVLSKAIDLLDDHVTIKAKEYDSIVLLSKILDICITLIDFDKYDLVYEESG